MSHFDSAPTGKLERPDGRSLGGIRPLASGSLTLICYLYVISLFIAVPYYNWQYSRGRDFADWLVWGEIVPTGKALVWPYFAVQSAKARAIDLNSVRSNSVPSPRLLTPRLAGTCGKMPFASQASACSPFE